MPPAKSTPPPAAIAGCTGRYREDAPPPALRPHFQCIWSNALPAQHTGAIAVVPDGCVDIIWRSGRLLVVGPDAVAAHPELTPGECVIGARFAPGAARHWLGLPLVEIVGRQIALAELQASWATTFTHRMEDATSPLHQAQVFQTQLAKPTRPVGTPDPGAAEIFRLAALSSPDEGQAIARIRERLALSERTLRRHCHDHFGYGPKTLQRILRFQRWLTCARGDRNAGLAALAVAAGYADQAHLTRETRALCGLNASALLDQVRR